MQIASIQADVKFREPMINAAGAIEKLEALAEKGIQVAVLPECYLTGYCVDSRDAAESLAISQGDASLQMLQDASNWLGIVVVVGFAERDGNSLFNSAALFEAGEKPRFYRKTHLPELGFDKFANPGDEIKVIDTKFGRIGIVICFDMRFPEPARILALQGADIILIPTNWPDGAQVSAESICIARAAESRVWVVTCNRVGAEEGFHFIGRSKIISPTGKVLEAADDAEEILTAEIDLAEARQKRTITIPGKYETDVFEPRRPELYGSLSANPTK
jgi:predicted amidohydrolase